MFMIMFVLDDINHLDDILTSWSEIGVTGATIVESSGLHRKLQKAIPMRYAYDNSRIEESGNQTLFVVVENETTVHSCLKAIENIVGDLDQPNTGVFSAWPLTMTKGIPSNQKGDKK